MDKHIIIGIHITRREEQAGKVQEIFTRFGDHIKTRIGLHDVHDGESSSNGFILLEMLDTEGAREMIEALRAVDGLDIQTMEFAH